MIKSAKGTAAKHGKMVKQKSGLHIHVDNRKNQASFKCVKCGLSMNTDLNASLNIKEAGLAVLDCGVDEMPSIQNATMKQEPIKLAIFRGGNIGILAF